MALPNIFNSMFAVAKQYIITNSMYSPYVLPLNPENSKIFPLVVIEQIDDPMIRETLDKKEKKYQITIEINIFAIDNTTTDKTIIAEELTYLVDEVFEDTLGMRRTENAPIPNIDDLVYRKHLRYKGIYDLEQNKMYDK